MNYIYDILLNFQERPYEFYDWNLDDNVLHIRKIPIIRIGPKEFHEIKNNNIIFDEEFKIKIKNKTEIFSNKSIKNLEYSCLLSNGLEVIAINMKDNNSYSKLLIDEEEEVLEIILKMKDQEIKFQKQGKIINSSFLTRKTIESNNYISKQLNNLYKENNEEKLKYIYLEVFNKKELDKNKIISKLNSEIKKENSKLNNKLFNVLKLFQTIN
ncbi:MAG: hypothetical protein ACK5HP_02345 [Bacilli bacterium]